MAFEHGVVYPPQYLDYDLRSELLRNSQTNITHNSIAGQQFAAAAYDVATANRDADPTAPGEALSKLGLQAEIAGQTERSDAAFQASVAELSGDDRRSQREIRATYSNRMRSLGLRLGRLIVEDDYDHGLYTDIHGLFDQAMEGMDDSDPYGVITLSKMAVIEAMVGNNRSALRKVGQGLVWATRVQQENANTASSTSLEARAKLASKHALFVGKQSAALLGVGLLGVASSVSKLHKQVVKRAVTWLG